MRAKWPLTISLQTCPPLQVSVRVHPRAKNYRLSINARGRPVLSVPPGGRVEEASAFVNRQQDWLLARLQQTPPPVPFVEGARVPLRGKFHELRGSGKLRGVVEIIPPPAGSPPSVPVLVVPGGQRHMARRLRDWLKGQALLDLKKRTVWHARRLNVSPLAVSVREQASRWGSCSSAGRLNYNWRLILAPPFVLDYVAAHEVSHLRHMDHSSAFWNTLEETLPGMEQGRSWLRAHGRELMAYGL